MSSVGLRYLKSILVHKWFVLRAGLVVGGVPLWRLIIHDWSKFLPGEFFAYAWWFFADRSKWSGPDEALYKSHFDLAWLHHQKFNPHHWQYWILVYDEEQPGPLPMPLIFICEMVADWMGASRAYTGSWDMTDWLAKQLPHISKYLHPDTIKHLAEVLEGLGFQKIPGREETAV